jgi:hypothetical protein
MVVDIFHRLGRYFEPLMEALKEAYRTAPVKHADETGWRNDGQNGYAWLFCTVTLGIFLFKNTRSSSVPNGIFGSECLPGVLVVDRYNGYNKLPLKIQYCCSGMWRNRQRTLPTMRRLHGYGGAHPPYGAGHAPSLTGYLR